MVHGINTDPESRCSHYRGSTDIIAIRFKCCGEYYACYECHEALAGHVAEVWPYESRDIKAILCGHCLREMTIREYMESKHQCPSCRAAFNPRCSLHYHLYFEPAPVKGKDAGRRQP